jgi:hypothetical protein
MHTDLLRVRIFLAAASSPVSLRCAANHAVSSKVWDNPIPRLLRMQLCQSTHSAAQFRRKTSMITKRNTLHFIVLASSSDDSCDVCSDGCGPCAARSPCTVYCIWAIYRHIGGQPLLVHQAPEFLHINDGDNICYCSPRATKPAQPPPKIPRFPCTA